MTYTFDENLVSDLHKDARGFRPSEAWWRSWNFQDDDGKQTAWNMLINELEESMEEKRQAEARAALALTERLEQMYELGAKDEVQALKWIMQAEDFSDYDLRYESSYFCYRLGLSYSAVNDFRIQEAIDDLLLEMA
jgi:hypothetical protein